MENDFRRYLNAASDKPTHFLNYDIKGYCCYIGQKRIPVKVNELSGVQADELMPKYPNLDYSSSG